VSISLWQSANILRMFLQSLYQKKSSGEIQRDVLIKVVFNIKSAVLELMSWIASLKITNSTLFQTKKESIKSLHLKLKDRLSILPCLGEKEIRKEVKKLIRNPDIEIPLEDSLSHVCLEYSNNKCTYVEDFIKKVKRIEGGPLYITNNENETTQEEISSTHNLLGKRKRDDVFNENKEQEIIGNLGDEGDQAYSPAHQNSNSQTNSQIEPVSKKQKVEEPKEDCISFNQHIENLIKIDLSDFANSIACDLCEECNHKIEHGLLSKIDFDSDVNL